MMKTAVYGASHGSAVCSTWAASTQASTVATAALTASSSSWRCGPRDRTAALPNCHGAKTVCRAASTLLRATSPEITKSDRPPDRVAMLRGG